MSGKKQHEQAEITALVRGVQSGNDAALPALLACFSPLMEKTLSSFRKTTVLASVDKDELWQELLICLYKAALRYDLTQSTVTFGLYFSICMKRRLISIKRRIERQEKKVSALLSDARRSPASPSGAATAKLLEKEGERLSKKEYAVFRLIGSGMSYSECAETLGCSIKSVDNALSRAKRKLKSAAGAG